MTAISRRGRWRIFFGSRLRGRIRPQTSTAWGRSPSTSIGAARGRWSSMRAASLTTHRRWSLIPRCAGGSTPSPRAAGLWQSTYSGDDRLMHPTVNTSQTPRELGYRWPAEWEPQASVWLSWPRNHATWPGHFEPVPSEFAHFVRLLAEYESVNILAGGREVLNQAKSLVGQLKNVTLHDIPTNDSWCRDHGPTFLSTTNPQSQIPNPKLPPPALIDWE